ncbi:MAG: HAD-IA family hydrolase [Ignavibacteriales bacterium]|nr:HAD-IA family hydrolase [Ignavibacteriales bacterium]
MIKAFAIDYDGVVADSQPTHFRAWQIAVDEMGAEIEVTPEAILGASVKEFTKSLGLTDADAVRLSDLKRAAVARLASEEPPPLYPTVKESLTLAATRYRLAIVSSVERPVAEAALRKHDLVDLFEFLVLEDSVENLKPAPDPYLEAVRKFGVAPEEVLAIEDSPTGVAAAKAAGVRIAAITNTTGPANLKDADGIVERFADVLPLAEDL